MMDSFSTFSQVMNDSLPRLPELYSHTLGECAVGSLLMGKVHLEDFCYIGTQVIACDGMTEVVKRARNRKRSTFFMGFELSDLSCQISVFSCQISESSGAWRGGLP